MAYRVGKKRGGAYLVSCLLVSTALATPLWAQSPSTDASITESATYQFNLQPMPLRSVVARITAVSGWRIFYAGDVPSDTMTQAVSGQRSVADAVSAALRGTGLSYRVTGPRSISIVRPGGTGDSATINDGSSLLETIVVKGNRTAASGSGFQGTPDYVYETAGSVSVVSREAINNSPSRNARDLLDTVAGVYANRSNGQDPGIAINIRGLQDQNRVVTMIDGARQNFQMSGHGATQRTYVDTAFVRSIDVDKMGGSGVGGAGNLGGSVNFRSIVADDLIAEGRRWGAEVNGTTGSNAFRYDGSIAAAARISDSFSVLGGYSRKKIDAYAIGKNGELTLNPATVIDSMPLFTGSDVESSILKVEGELTEDLDLSLSWLRNESSFNTGYAVIAGALAGSAQANSISTVDNNTFSADLAWDPDSELIDARAKLWYNHLKFDQRYQTYFISTLESIPVNYRLGTIGGSLENTSRLDTPLGPLALNYGIEAFRDDGKTEVDGYIQLGETGQNGAAGKTGPNPTGTRDVVSVFSSATLEPTDWLTVTGGLRYDWYRTTGTASFVGLARRTLPVAVCDDPAEMAQYPSRSSTCMLAKRYNLATISEWHYPKFDIPIDQSDGALLPSLTVAVEPWDGIQPFVKYARTFRPPTLMEQLWGGQHTLFSTPIGYAPNENLRAEEAGTYEVGVNISRDGLLTENDSFRMKVVGFYREVEDYIALGFIHRAEVDRTYTSFVNLDGVTRMKGLEIEGNYDARFFYAGASLTLLDTDYADSYIYNGPLSHNPNSGAYILPGGRLSSETLFAPPDFRMTADAGVRLFEERLTLGGRVTHSSGGKTGETATYQTKDFTIYDLYGSYKFNDSAKLRFGVSNVTDLAYVPALGTNDLPAAGRTFTASLNFRF